MNNFQRLYEDEERSFAEKGNREVLNNLQGTLSLFRIMGDVADIYLSRLVDVLVTAMDPDDPEMRPSGPENPPPSDGPVDDPGDRGPEIPPE